MAENNTEVKHKKILLGQYKGVPNDIWEKMCAEKRRILENNKHRSYVSNEEAIYNLIRNNCA